MAGGAAITLAGRGVADVVSSLADLSKVAGRPQTGTLQVRGDMAARITEIKLLMDRNGLKLEPLVLPAYAEIRIFEPQVVDGHMVWQPVIQSSFDRTVLGVVTRTMTPPAAGAADKGSGDPKTPDGATPGARLPGASTPPEKLPPAKDPGAPSKGVPPRTVQQNPWGTPETAVARLEGGTQQIAASQQTAATQQRAAMQQTEEAREAEFFGQTSPVENAIASSLGYQIANTIPLVQPQGQPQAAIVGGAAPVVGGVPAQVGGGNQVTVNVNPPRWRRFCWPFCKSKPRIRQQAIAGPDNSFQLTPSLDTGSQDQRTLTPNSSE